MKKVFLWTTDETAWQKCQAVCRNQGYLFEKGSLHITQLYQLAAMTSVVIVDGRTLSQEELQNRLFQLEKQWKRPIILIGNQPKWHFRYSYQLETISDIDSDVEVLFTINKVMKAVEKIGNDENIIVYPDLTVNLNTYEVYFGDQLTKLTYKEINIIGLLARIPEQVCSREQILLHLGITPLGKEERSVDHLIKRLRKKISPDLQWEIKSVYGKGYMFFQKKFR